MNLLISFVLFTFAQNTLAEVFSSTALLKVLVKYEDELKEEVLKYLHFEKEQLENAVLITEDLFQQKIDTLKTAADLLMGIQTPPSSLPKSVTYAGHPINAYHLVNSWSNLLAWIPQLHYYQPFSDYIKARGIVMPTGHDKHGAALAIIRLQRLYNLDTNEVVYGNIKGYIASKGLDAADMYYMGQSAMGISDYGMAAQWFSKAVEGVQDKSWKAKIYIELAKANQMIGDYEEALKDVELAETTDWSNEVMSVTRPLNLRLELEMMRSPHQPGINMTTWKMPPIDGYENYDKLCRGDSVERPRSVLKTLTCRYKPGKIPYVTYKEETLSWDPRISMFYDVISDKSAEMIKTEAAPLLYRAMVGSGDPTKSEIRNIRVSQVTWFWDSTYPFVKKLSESIEDVTGLDTQITDFNSSAEAMQVVNYGIGGQYEPHHDFFENMPTEHWPIHLHHTGDRISTFLYYLSDVQIGGSTVFPELGVRVPAIKNAAAFWYNVKPSGEYEKQTLHAGCPVLLGEKWVANKWIRERGQTFRRPCGLTSDAIWNV